MNTQKINNDLIALEQWCCDHCGEKIERVEDGWLEWYRDIRSEEPNFKGKGFRIVHHSPKCMYDSREMYRENKLTADMHLEDFTGPDGLVYLLSFIENQRVEDPSELIEIIRRIHTPYYEEARKYHHEAEADGFFDGENEITRYTTSSSIYILNNYK